jgi:3-phenylpropionate/cinnamic acid dioxygenase small subunit
MSPERVSSSVRPTVAELLARYAELIDDGDFAGIGALLADATITIEDGSVVARGARAIEAFYAHFTRRFDDGTPHTQHQITNLIVEPDERAGRYVARSVFVVFQATDDLPLQPIITGRYRDVVTEHDDGTVSFVEPWRC